MAPDIFVHLSQSSMPYCTSDILPSLCYSLSSFWYLPLHVPTIRWLLMACFFLCQVDSIALPITHSGYWYLFSPCTHYLTGEYFLLASSLHSPTFQWAPELSVPVAPAGPDTRPYRCSVGRGLVLPASCLLRGKNQVAGTLITCWKWGKSSCRA